MTISSPDINGHLTITAPGAAALVTGSYTVACLFRNLPNLGSNIWYPYESANFARTSLYFDGSMWVGFQSWSAGLDITTAHDRWLVVSKAAGTTVPKVHAAEYVGSGAFTWQHDVVNGSQANFFTIDRISIGDEFGNGMRGGITTLAAFTSELTQSQIEAIFARSSATILAASPQFFVHFPAAGGLGSTFHDLAGGGVETIRSGSWAVATDPANYDFSLTSGRSGKVNRWNGSAWDPHPVKSWNGTSWATHPIAAYNGTDWITGK